MWKEAEKSNLFRGEPVQMIPRFGNFDILPWVFQLLIGIGNWIALESQGTPLYNTFFSFRVNLGGFLLNQSTAAMWDFCEQHQVLDAQFQTLLCFGSTGTSLIVPAESFEIELICLNIPRVPWLALTLGLALSLYQNYEGDHGWLFSDYTFLKPDNIA